MPHGPSPEKSSIYFALLEAFDKSGCPVCRLMTEYSLSFLDHLFYEQVNDVGTRRKLRAARGLCNWHAWQTRLIDSSALGAAIIAKDLLSEEITRLDDLLGRSLSLPRLRGLHRSLHPRSLQAFIQGWRRKQICIACQIILDHERHALETLLNFLPAEAFARQFENSAALCAVHVLRTAEANSSHPSLRQLIAIQRGRYARLVAELEEFCRKHDYRFSREAWGSESDAWLRAIEMLAGKSEVFGNEVYRRDLTYRSIHWWRKVIDRCRQCLHRGTPVALPRTSGS
jgi:Family of unknown function (DUF6062)